MANSQTYFHLLISMISTINKIIRRKYLKMIKEILLIFLVGLTLSSEVLSPENITLTVYKGGYAVIKDNRKIKYDAGISTVYITDLPSAVSPASIIITPDNSTAKIRILEKNFESNDQGKSATLKNYINKTISFETSSGSPRIRTGKLLAFDDNFIKIQNPSGQVQVYHDSSSIKLPPLPQNTITSPTIVFVASASNPTVASTQVIYRAQGISWNSKYVIVFSNDDKTASITGTIFIENDSGKNFNNATLKIMAGDVQSAQDPPTSKKDKIVTAPTSPTLQLPPHLSPNPREQTFSYERISDRSLYSMNYPTNLNDSSIKQINFFGPINNITVQKSYNATIRPGVNSEPFIDFNIIADFNNSKENGLGGLVPQGNFQVYKKSQAQSLQFLSEFQGVLDDNQNFSVNLGTQPAFLQGKITVLDRIIEKLTQSQKLNLTDKTNATASRKITKYASVKEMNITNLSNQPALVKLDLNNFAVAELAVSYNRNYNGTKWSKDNKIVMTIPPNTTETFQWTEKGVFDMEIGNITELINRM